MKNPLVPFLATSTMLTQLAAASWETLYHRAMLMAFGNCTFAEYQRMVSEKVSAMQLSTIALMSGRSPEDILAPYHVRATANAQRLRIRS
jgi:hypothetical protein